MRKGVVMVKLGKKSFVVEVKSTQPANDYVETVNDLLIMLRDCDPEMSENNRFYAFELIREMLPTIGQAEIMFEDMDTDE